MNNQQLTKIILVRHGRSTYNEQGRYQGSSDESVLTEKGAKEAYLTGLALKQFTFDAIYSSPLQRVQQTTEEIVKALSKFHDNLPTTKSDRRLQEIKMSTWEGLPYAHVRENFAGDYDCWQKTPHLLAFPSAKNAETEFFPLQELYQRAKLFLAEIINKHRGQTVLIVAHGGTNRALISTAIGLSPDLYHSLQQSNCGISCLEFTADNSLFGQLKWLNVTNHLGENLPKLKESKTGLRWLLVSNKTERDSQFAEYLESGAIDLIISDRDRQSQKLADTYKKQISQAVHISVTNQNFLIFWQNSLIEKHQSLSNLITGLIVIEESLLKKVLTQLFPIKSDLNIDRSFSVIHYPKIDRHPILQGLLPTQKIIEFV
jgi:phosphoserine phosphatase